MLGNEPAPSEGKYHKELSPLISQERITASQKQDLVQEALKMQFEFEYHVLVKYVKFMIPLMSAIHVASVS